MHNKCNAPESSRNHPPTPRPPVRGKIVFHETSPWCQKGWGPLVYTTILLRASTVFPDVICHFVPTGSRESSGMYNQERIDLDWTLAMGCDVLWLPASQAVSYLATSFIGGSHSPVSLEHQGDQTFLFLSPWPLGHV